MSIGRRAGPAHQERGGVEVDAGGVKTHRGREEGSGETRRQQDSTFVETGIEFSEQERRAGEDRWGGTWGEGKRRGKG